MNSKTKIALTLVGFLVILAACQKKAFKKVTVTGRILHASTGLPFQKVKVCLYANDVHDASSYAVNTIELRCTETDDNGSFKIRSSASKVTIYYLRVDGKKVQVANYDSFSIKDNTTKDLGDVVVDF
jgi:predicted component of type VI protein secretion system